LVICSCQDSNRGPAACLAAAKQTELLEHSVCIMDIFSKWTPVRTNSLYWELGTPNFYSAIDSTPIGSESDVILFYLKQTSVILTEHIITKPDTRSHNPLKICAFRF